MIVIIHDCNHLGQISLKHIRETSNLLKLGFISLLKL